MGVLSLTVNPWFVEYNADRRKTLNAKKRGTLTMQAGYPPQNPSCSMQNALRHAYSAAQTPITNCTTNRMCLYVVANPHLT